MRKLFIIVSLVVFTACSSNNSALSLEENTANLNLDDSTTIQNSNNNSSPSFPFPLLVWNNEVYRVTSDEELNVKEQIGEVEYYTETPVEAKDNISNYFKKGTKIWSIVDVDTNIAIAAEYDNGKFVKLVKK